MKNALTLLASALLIGCLFGSSAQGHSVYARPVYRYYEPVTYYREVVERAPVYVSEPVYVRRAYPVRTCRPCHRQHYYRPCRGYASVAPFFGGFNFSIGF